jgi:WD40 repeat protein
VHDVFISYARDDRARVERLADAFVAARGWSVWWDSELQAGEPFPRRIQEALADSRCVVVVWSSRAVESDWVVAEATEGWGRGILVPVRIDECEPPLPFRQTQAVDLGHWKGSRTDAAFLALLESMQRTLARGEAIDPAELEARERRRRSHRRRRLARRLAVVAGVLVAVLAAGVAARAWVAHSGARRIAEDLARHADDVRREAMTFTPEEEKRRWFALIRGKRLDRVELSVLLAAEGVKRARTERTEQSLRASLALLPWSDWHLEVGFDDVPCVLDFNRDGRLLAAGGGSSGTIVVRLETKELTARIPHGRTGGKCDVIDFSPTADIVATAGPDASAALWDGLTGRELRRLSHDAAVTSVAFDGTGKLVATATQAGSVALWDVESGRRLQAMTHGDAVSRVDFSPSSKRLASASRDGTVRVWEPGTGRERLRLVHGAAVEGARFTPDETAIATFGRRVPTRLWNADTGAEVWRLPDQSAGPAGVLFDPQGRIMVLGDVDGKITWWDVQRRTPLFSVSHDGPYVRRMALTPDGRFLVSIAADDEARVWDFGSGRLLKRLAYGGVGGGGRLFGVAVSPDGRWFATAGLDPSVLEMAIEVTEIWPADPVAAACAKLRRNLTREEWDQYVGAEVYRPTCSTLAKE